MQAIDPGFSSHVQLVPILSLAARGARARAGRAMLFLLVLVCSSASLRAIAHARPNPRGPLVEATPIGALRMQGRHFVGFKLDGDQSQFTLIHVLGFLGDRVDARVTSKNGWVRRQLHARDLIGVEWVEHDCDVRGRCANIKYRITGAAMDRSENTMPAHKSNRDVWLYDVETTRAANPGPADWRPACAGDAHGLRQGLFITGELRPDGSRTSAGYTFACTAGVVAKCVRSWGYKPWKHLVAPGGQSIHLAPLHQACVRAARADYCGDGNSYTRNGTLVDIFDIYGFNVREHVPGFSAEAGFSPSGAAWVARPRWPIAGALQSDSWLELPHCRRPTAPRDPRESPVLLYVWSQTRR